MKKTSKAVAAVGIAAAAIAGAGALSVYVDRDGGGSVYGYVQHYDELRANGTKVFIRGACYSSCTMALGYDNACLMDDAVLGFHPAYVPYFFGLASYRLDAAATDVMRQHYPPDALAIINQHGGLNYNGGWLRPAIRTIKASEFPAHYHCA